ncbi:MAG: hypothetical protein KC464_30595, partial [Myxococcales bacterium]|nr:hypothetical protein [Myxococcales bacterium]
RSGSAAPSSSPAAAPPATAAPTDDPDAEIAITVPPGFVQDGTWYVAKQVENRGGGDEITSALVAVLPPQPRQADAGAALGELWRSWMPPELKDALNPMAYRRYVGDGLGASFTFGVARERDHQADSLFALYLVECGARWQPIVVAQTYAEPGNPNASLVAMSGRVSFPTSARLAEPFLAALRCPGHADAPLVDPRLLPGRYRFGTSGSQEWVQLGTGATYMTAVSYGGELDLGDDGGFTYRFAGASGRVGNMDVSTDDGAGRWRVERDLLVLAFDDGRTSRYRIAGVAALSDTSKAAVFLSDLSRPVDPTTVTDGGAFYVAPR